MSFTISSLPFQADNQPQNRYSEPDNRDWRGRSAQVPVYGDDRSSDKIRENRDLGDRHEQLNLQFAGVQISAQQVLYDCYTARLIIFFILFIILAENSVHYLKLVSCLTSLSLAKQGEPPPALIKAEVPWSVRRGNLSEEDRVLKTVKG